MKYKQFSSGKNIVLLMCVLMTLSVSTIYGQQPAVKNNEPQTLTLNQPIERQIKGGETQAFQFNVKAGFYARAEVEQKNIDVVVSLFDSTGKLIVEMNGKDERLWRKSLSTIAERKGVLQIEVKAYGTAKQAGNYTIKLAQQRSHKPADRKWLEAESHISAGINFYLQDGEKDFEAAKEYEAAIRIWRELGEAEWEAVTLTNLGWTNDNLSKHKLAIEAHTRAVELFQKNKDRLGEAKAVHGIGNVYYSLGQYDNALEFYQKALDIRKEIGDRQGESRTLINLGTVYSNSLKQNEKARNYYEQALIIKREIKDTLGEALILVKLVNTFNQADKNEKVSQYLNQALTLIRSVENYKEKIAEIIAVCNSYSFLNNINEKNIQCYEEALTVSQKAKDRKSEIGILLNLGIRYSTTKPEREILYREQALSIAREIKDKSEELSILRFLGWLYSRQGKYEKALQTYEQTISLSRELKNRESEEEAIREIGDLYFELKNYEKAQNYYEQSFAIQKELKLDASAEDVYLFLNTADTYRKFKQYGKALEVYEKALTLYKDEAYETTILRDLANLFKEQKQYDNALEIYKKALAITPKHNPWDTSITLNALANLFKEQKQYDKAQKYLEQNLALSREIKESFMESEALIELGELFQEQKQYEKAARCYEQSLAIEPDLEKNTYFYGNTFNTLSHLGKLYLELKQYEKARIYLERAFAEFQHLSLSFGYVMFDVRDIYSSLIELYKGLEKPQLAIFYGKSEVNIYQNLRREIKNFDKNTQGSFAKDKEPAYRRLADLLISEGRLPEAQSVLDLLKQEEFKDVVLRRSGETPDTVPYSKAEAEVAATVENLAKLERERAELLKQKEQGTIPADKQTRLDKIPTEIEAANKAFRLALDALGKSEVSSANRVAEIQGEKSLQRALQTLDKETDSEAVALYTVLGTEPTSEGSDKTKTKFGWVILVTPTLRKAYPIDVTDLEQTVFQFREALISDRYDPRPVAQKLYTKIFRQTSAKQKTTLETDLQTLLSSSKNKTLMWSLDGILRYVPMAALYDGKNYLVEKYSSVIFTKESFLTLTEKDTAKWNALGLGVSEKRENFNALPGAERELKDIVRPPQTKTGIIDGVIKLNKDFSKGATLKLLREGAFPVVHIASHYSFNATDPTSSFLLVGDGHLSFSEMQDSDNLFGTIDLLTLSACDTAISGNGKEAEGFAYLAQSLGAKSVIASLWQVSDDGTPELMIRFYKLRAQYPEIPKGEAFRKAQVSLLSAETKDIKKNYTILRATEIVGATEQKSELPLFIKDEKNPFAHPHFWSAFVLIGNWR